MLPVRYRDAGGAAVISTTQILTLAGRIDTTWFTAESAWRGRVVHTLTEFYDRDEPMDIPDGLDGYMDAYAMFVSVVRPVYLASELPVVSESMHFGGRIDRVVTMFGVTGILDFKTSDPSPWHGEQLAAYNALYPTGARWVCYLRSTGRFKLMPYENPQDHRQFMYDLARIRGTITPDGDHWVTM